MRPRAWHSCGDCRHLANSAPGVEDALPGLTSLSSAYAAVRADDGICGVHQRYVAASSICASHAILDVNLQHAGVGAADRAAHVGA